MRFIMRLMIVFAARAAGGLMRGLHCYGVLSWPWVGRSAAFQGIAWWADLNIVWAESEWAEEYSAD